MIIAGRFALPENVPMNPYGGCLKLGLGGAQSAPGMGVFVPAHQSLSGIGNCGGSCGCGGSCSGGMSTGMGDLNLESFIQPLTNEVFGIPLWMLAGGALALVMIMSSRGAAGSGYKAAKAQARAKYQAALRDADEEYGRRYKRYGRAVAGSLGY